MMLTLPWPPSVNHYWRTVTRRGRPTVLLTPKGERYRVDVHAVILSTAVVRPIDGPMEIRVLLYPPDRRRRDIDNTQKALLDAMQHAGLYEDDYQISKLTIERHEPCPPGRVEVTLSQRGN